MPHSAPLSATEPPLDDQGAIDKFIINQAPGWIKSASLEQLDELHMRLSTYHATRLKVSTLLSRIQPADQFAINHFKRIIEEACGVVDIKLAEWREFRLRVDPPVFRITDSDIPIFDLYPIKENLLQRLIRGFDISQCKGSYYYDASGVLSEGGLLGTKPELIAVRCREADVGMLYQKHVQDVFFPESIQEREYISEVLIDNQKDMFWAQAHCSFLKGDIDEAALRLCTALVEGSSALHFHDLPVRCKSLSVFGVPLSGAFLFEAMGKPLPGAIRWYEQGLVRQLLLYLPGDPNRPFRQYPSWYALRVGWAKELMEKKYLDFFVRQFQMTRQSEVVNRLSARGDDPVLELDGALIGTKVFEVLAANQIARIKADAASVIVPVEQIDQASHQRWVDDLKAASVSGAQFLASFIPGVNGLMLLSFLKDILSEVYEGVHDWSHGEQADALSHFANVMRSVAISALAGAAGHLAIGAIARSDYIARLFPVINKRGERRLANPDLEPYGEHPIEWADGREMLNRGSIDTHDLTHDQAGDMLVISRVDAAFLRGMLIETTRFPVELRDTLARFRIDQRVTQFVAQAAVEPGALDTYDAELFECAQRLVAPEKMVTADIYQVRHELFNLMVRRLQVSSQPGFDVIRRDFPSFPENYAEGLLEYLTDYETQILNVQKRIPLSVAERIPKILRDVREKRAVEGLYFDNFFNADSVLLLIKVCSQSLEWPRELDVEVRQESMHGKLLYLQRNIASEAVVLVCQKEGVDVYKGEKRRRFTDIYMAILDLLGDARSERLGWQDIAQMRRSITAAVLKNRSAVASWLGILEPSLRYRPVQRLSDGRLGYELSGRAPAKISTLTSMVKTLYPGFDNEKAAAFLEEARRTHDDLFNLLLGLQEKYRLLEESLHRWQQRGRGLGRARRYWLARKIKQCWRRQSRPILDSEKRIVGYALKIDSREFDGLSEFPDIDFSHVLELKITNANLASGADVFLSCFKSLKTLELSDCDLKGLPDSVGRLATLKQLVLRHNRIALEQDGCEVISSFKELQLLDLNGTTISGSIDLHKLPKLRTVRFRGCGLTRIPDGLLMLPFLEFADLRDNEFLELPGDEAELLPRVRNALLFSGTGSSGPGEWLFAPDAYSLLSFDKVLQAYLKSSTGESRTKRIEVWNNLLREEGGRDFFELLRRLIDTEEFKNVYADLSARVWAMMEAMSSDTSLRETLFSISAQPVRCVDGAANIFSDLEIRLRVHNIAAGVQGDEQRSGITRLARGLFRLEQLQNIARIDMLERGRRGQEVDEIEISLAYRMALKEHLDLPGQPVETQFSDLVYLTEGELQAALEKIKQAESSNQLIRFISELEFWEVYLRKEFQAEFESVENIYWRKLDQLVDEQSTLLDGAYLQKITELGREREVRLKELKQSLTGKVLY